MERWSTGGRGAAVVLTAMAVGALAAARTAWAVGAAGALLVAAVVVWRRSAPLAMERRGEWWRAFAIGVGLLAVAQLVGLLVRDESAGLDAISRSDGRLGLPPAPFAGPAAYTARLADGTVVRAWPTGAAVLHLRVDTSATACSGGTWREWWHTADLPGVRVGAGGTFRETGGRVERDRVAVHTSAFVIRGVRTDGGLRGMFVRTDRYRGHVHGVCRRTVRFTAAASR